MRRPYDRAVPLNYRGVAGFEHWQPEILRLDHGPFDCFARMGAPLRAIAPSAFCRVRTSDRPLSVVVSASDEPSLFDAISHISDAVTAKTRLHRFSTAYKAYESLEREPDADLAAIRHAINHPATVLTRPKTVAALHSLFGSTRIDLQDAAHRRIFYRELGRLIIKIDAAIAEAIRSGRYRWSAVPRGYRPAVAAYAKYYASAAV